MAKGNEQGNGRQDFRQERLDRKLELAKRDDMEVISRRAAETNDFIRLLSANDYIINRLRNQLGRPSGVPVDEAVKFLERNEELRQGMNRLNAEMCKALGMSYRAPRGFENPLKEIGQQAEGKNGAVGKGKAEAS
jgi:hypothetical protein